MNTIVVCSIILILCALFSSLSPKYKLEPYIESSLALQSEFAGPDNLDKSLDAAKSSCLYYVTERRKWTDLFGDDENGRKRKFAISGMQSARGQLIGGAGKAPITFYDACVIPKEMLASYGLNNECMLKTVKGNVQLEKTIPLMYPEGCMIDFSGQLTNSVDPNYTSGESAPGKAFSKDMFDDMLLKAYSGMNYNSEKTIQELKTTVKEKEEVIQDRDNTIVNKNDIITRKEKEVSDVTYKLTVAQGDEPSWVYAESVRSWVTPRKDEYIATVRDLGITTASSMSITFWIEIERKSSSWRNIFQVTQKTQFGMYQLDYDPDEDMYRRPAVYIIPNSYALHIAHDTKTAKNVTANTVDLSGFSMIALVWNGRALNIYINGKHVQTFKYESDLLDADKTAQLFFASRFHYSDGFKIRHLKWFNTALDILRVERKYTVEQTQI